MRFSSQPTASKIRAAKNKAVGGGRKRCRKGKNCSAACIQSSMVCLVELPESVMGNVSRLQSFLNKGAAAQRAPSMPSGMRRELQGLGGGAPPVVDVKAKTMEKSAQPLSASGNTRHARRDAEDFDADLKGRSTRRVGDKEYDKWDDSHKSGSSKVGEGSYGSVIRNEDGTYVKRGAVSNDEAALINELGKRDLGPKLIAADINGRHWMIEDGVMSPSEGDMRYGRIAMTRVPGKPMGETSTYDTQFAGKNAADVYWTALGNLHRAGIAHNDAHIDNIMVDNKGTGRWVDMGMALKSPKAAFAEAYGSFAPGVRDSWTVGNHQAARWDAIGIKDFHKREDTMPNGGSQWASQFPVFGRVVNNQSRVAAELRSMGFSAKEIEQIQNTPIRSSPEVFQQGPWAKMTDAQASKLIDTFYDGI